MSLNLRKPSGPVESRHSHLGLFLILVLTLSVSALASDWQKKVPEADRSAVNPLANDASAAADGAKIYSEKCAKCHGANGEGKGSHPSLRTQKMQEATPGELHWIITHGTGMHGMPSFGKLSDTERWQLVSYIKSLQGSAGGQPPGSH
jgi:mono/diheme cytochrome c family protein